MGKKKTLEAGLSEGLAVGSWWCQARRAESIEGTMEGDTGLRKLPFPSTWQQCYLH